MPTEARAGGAHAGVQAGARAAPHPLAARRILRLALGTSLSLVITQAIGWPLAFIAPVLTMFLLALPLPAPGIRKGLSVVVALVLPMIASLALLPFLAHARWAGIVLVALALYYTFYFTARGGAPVLGTFMTVGLTLVVTVGSVSPELLVLLIGALGGNALVGVAFVWLAFLLLPDPPREGPAGPPPAPPQPDLADAPRNALRSLLVVLPLALVFLYSSASAAYVPVMIKVASMGQQASADRSREMGRSLLKSTLWGGLGAFLAWGLLRIWPGLIPYTLVVALAALWFGRRMFRGVAVTPDFSTWSYAFLTMLVLLGPAVADSPLGGGIAFGQRLALFILIAVYGTMAVAVFDAFWPRRPSAPQATPPTGNPAHERADD